MESSTDTPQVKQKKGIKKLWARWKASRKSQSINTQTSTPTPATTTQAKPDTASAATPVLEPTPTVATPTEPTKTATSPPTTVPEGAEKPLTSITDVIEVDEGDDEETPQVPLQFNAVRSGLDKTKFERAQAIFQKYNMKLDAADWYAPSKPNVERVEKKPRMRVRYTCHQCKAAFGKEKTCPQCSHQRCSTCARYPQKKNGDKATKAARKIENVVAPTVADIPTTGACHECKTSFTIGDPSCSNCKHGICERCLKETIIASPATSPATSPPSVQPIAIAAAS